jgi:hypothetical protein
MWWIYTFAWQEKVIFTISDFAGVLDSKEEQN